MKKHGKGLFMYSRSEKSLKKKFYLMGLLFFFSMLFILLFGYLGIQYQSTMRGYVTGEGLYSKAQKTATYDLLRYVETENESYYNYYREQIKVPLGIRTFFGEIYGDVNKTKLYEGYYQGRNSPEDVFIINYFLLARNLKPVLKSHDQFLIGDNFIRQLETLADEIHSSIQAGNLTETKKEEIIRQLDNINRDSIIHQNEYSKILGDVSRWVSKTFILQTVLITLIGLFISFFVYTKLTSKLLNDINQLTESSEKISSGDFSSYIHVHSYDEIGDLVNSFNQMTTNLSTTYDQLKSSESSLQSAKQQLQGNVKKLKKANEKLKELDKVKDQFISISAHELKTPLTSIKGFTQLLLTSQKGKKLTPKKQKEMLARISNNVDRLYELVLDIVDSSRLSLGKITLTIKPITVASIIKEIKGSLLIILKENNLKGSFTAQAGLVIQADQKRLLQVLRNIIINAVHYTPTGGRIRVRVEKQKGMALFLVEDSGVGIPKDKQEHLFSKFYQAGNNDPNKKNLNGSGLGLSVSKGLVEAMKGKMWFESEENKGTTFYFTLPLKKK